MLPIPIFSPGFWALIVTGGVMVLAGVEFVKRVLHLQGLACVAVSFVLSFMVSAPHFGADPSPLFYIFLSFGVFAQANGLFKVLGSKGNSSV